MGVFYDFNDVWAFVVGTFVSELNRRARVGFIITVVIATRIACDKLCDDIYAVDESGDIFFDGV